MPLIEDDHCLKSISAILNRRLQLKNPKTEIFAQYFSMQCESWTISLPLKFLLFPNGDVVLRGVKTSESNFEKEQ